MTEDYKKTVTEINEKPSWVSRIIAKFRSTSFDVMNEEEKLIKKQFLDDLIHGNQKAYDTYHKFHETIDFTHEIKEGFFQNLKYGQIDTILKIRAELNEGGIDFTKIPGYMEAVKNAFLIYSRKGQIDRVLTIRDELGEGIDFTAIPGYEEAVKGRLLNSLKGDKIDNAIQIHDELCKGLDCADEIKKGFLIHLKRDRIDHTSEIRNKLGAEIDFTSEIKEVFFSSLVLDLIDKAIRIYIEHGKGIDFTDQIQEAFLSNLIMNHIDDAVKIRNKLGEGIDFYLEYYYYLTHKKSNFHSFLIGKNDQIEPWRNKLDIQEEGNVPDELLTELHSIIFPCLDALLRCKTFEDMGYDLENLPNIGELSYGEQKKISHFHKKNEREIRNRFQSITSPAVFEAYKSKYDNEDDGMKYAANFL